MWLWPEHGDEARPPHRGPDADRVVADAVTSRLQMDDVLRRQRLVVAVQNRVVILLGVVTHREIKAAVGSCAWATPGVFDVCNRISVMNQRPDAP